MTVLVTGAGGFVGRALVPRLVSEGIQVRALVRRQTDRWPAAVERIAGDITASAEWATALVGVDAVVHLAARVHVMRDTPGAIDEFRRVNVDATADLAGRAAAAGVRRFVYLSSVKVSGEAGRFSESDPPAPADAYGISKHEAEVALRRLAGESRMEVVIIRPPLVYGPGVRANFRSLARAVARGLPLPLGAVRNRRSLVAVDNLVDFIVTCLRHPAAANETFFVSDDDDVSTAELIVRLGRALGRRPRLLPVPPFLLTAVARALGRGDAAQRLVGSLQVDVRKARTRLGWTPPISLDEGLRRVAASL